MGTHGEIHNDNIIKATMEELTEEERKAYLIAEEHLKGAVSSGIQEGARRPSQEGRGVRDAIVQVKPRQGRGTS